MSIEQIIYSVKPLENDANYLSLFSYYIKSFEEFNAKEIENYINEIHPEIVNIINRKNMKPNSSRNEKESNDCKSINDESTRIIEEDEDVTCLMYEEDEETCILSEEDGDTELFEENEETFLLEDVQENIYMFPSLIRTVTGECIKVNKTVFRIGKQEGCVDYIITNNVAISRSHIDIITRGKKCFVFDLRSKNKSYINNRVIPTEQEVEIFNGDVLRLADEEFLFQM